MSETQGKTVDKVKWRFSKGYFQSRGRSDEREEKSVLFPLESDALIVKNKTKQKHPLDECNVV